MDKAVPILTYHSLDCSGSVISLPPELFRSQIELLVKKQYQGISLRELLHAWNGTGKLPKRAVVLTFDDGFESVLEHAAPTLVKFQFQATVFAVAGYLGKLNDWPSQPKEIPRMPLMDRKGLRSLGKNGFEIGAHGYTHVPLNTIPMPMVRWEITECKRALEELGQPISTFAFPVGRVSPESLMLVRDHFQAACSTRMSTARPWDDLHCLPRIDIHYLRNFASFRLFGTPLGQFYLAIRACGRNLRRGLFEANRDHPKAERV